MLGEFAFPHPTLLVVNYNPSAVGTALALLTSEPLAGEDGAGRPRSQGELGAPIELTLSTSAAW